MKAVIDDRFNKLLEDGRTLVSAATADTTQGGYWMDRDLVVACNKWLTSVSNLIRTVDSATGAHRAECDKAMAHKDLSRGAPCPVIMKMYGILQSAHEDWQQGLLRRIEHIVVAEAFDDFLDRAAIYHKGKKKIEASVLVSAVLEDTVKRIASKEGVAAKGKKLDSLVSELVTAEVFTPVKAKRVRSYAGVRNHALHAEWDEFDVQDVGQMITGVRELIEQFL